MLAGLRIVITAGPTWEALDPVRGITNRSSGKMGYAIAQVAAQQSAQVVLISGPVCIKPPQGLEFVSVESAQQMYDAVHANIAAADVFIGVAAVADYRPAQHQTQKIKKQGASMTLELVKNPDIVASVGQLPQPRPFTVGFAAETQNVAHYAREKLKHKGLDLIAANDVSDPDLGFGTEHNRLVLFTGTEKIELGQRSKTQLATQLLMQINNRLKRRENCEAKN